MANELKPCPFCGGVAYMSIVLGSKYIAEIGCASYRCKFFQCFISADVIKARRLAVTAWNRRAGEKNKEGMR
ncbi:MAG: Lar family restriction alleviation protein [Burkholderiales bacterium]|jgi:hypothetical protein|nr:Lar family restriction alleviation protein [Burkholderiales bacterium]